VIDNKLAIAVASHNGPRIKPKEIGVPDFVFIGE
jgi:hypothetical protein